MKPPLFGIPLASLLGAKGVALSFLVSGAISLPLLTWKTAESFGVRYKVATVLRPIAAAVPMSTIFLIARPGVIENFFGGLIWIFIALAAMFIPYFFLLAFVGHYDEVDYEAIEDTLVGIHPKLKAFG